MTTRAEYVPGVCNIGKAEIQRRRQSGWIGLVATVVLWAVFFIFRVPAPWRLFLFFRQAWERSGFSRQGCTSVPALRYPVSSILDRKWERPIPLNRLSFGARIARRQA